MKKILSLLLALLLACLPAPAIAAGTAFENIAYLGDPGACKMDAQMALAYAEVLEGLPRTEADTYSLYATLADFADDGYPVLFTMYLDKESDYWFADLDDYHGVIFSGLTFWGYKDGAAYKTEISWASYGKLGGKGMLYYHVAGPNESVSEYYTISQGQIELAHKIANYYTEWYEARGELWGPAPEGATYVNSDGTLDESKLAENGWIQEEDGTWRLTLDNGEPVTRKYLDGDGESVLGSTPDIKGRISGNGEGGYWHVSIDNSPAAGVSAALRAYAASAGGPSAPAYTVLGSIAYVGDRAKCSMDAQVALAYAEVIESLPTVISDEYNYQGTLYVALADFADDGWPILLTMYLDNDRSDGVDHYGDFIIESPAFWGYKNGAAYKTEYNRLDYDNGYGKLDGKGMFYNRSFNHNAGMKRTSWYYTISHAQIGLARTIEKYDAYSLGSQGGNDKTAFGMAPEGADYAISDYLLDETRLAENGWVMEKGESNDSRYWYLTFDNGKNVTRQFLDGGEESLLGPGFIVEGELAEISDGAHHMAIDTTPGAAAADALRSYASSQPASGGIGVTVGGVAVAWTDAVPFIDENDRTMVPLRAVADAMVLDVTWDAAKREAAFTGGGKTIWFPIGSGAARTSDSGTVQMDTAAVIVNERTYAPIRYLAEYFGYGVDWDAGTRTVIITGYS